MAGAPAGWCWAQLDEPTPMPNLRRERGSVAVLSRGVGTGWKNEHQMPPLQGILRYLRSKSLNGQRGGEGREPCFVLLTGHRGKGGEIGRVRLAHSTAGQLNGCRTAVVVSARGQRFSHRLFSDVSEVLLTTEERGGCSAHSPPQGENIMDSTRRHTLPLPAFVPLLSARRPGRFSYRPG